MRYLGYFGQLPKPGSTNTGPEPAAPAGGWPPFKGKPGAKQQACTAQGGRWIGPAGKKWCQMTSAVQPQPQPLPEPMPPVGWTPPVVYPPVTGYVPPPVVPPQETVPPGSQQSTGGPVFGPPPGANFLEDQAVSDVAGGGQVTMSAGAGVPAGGALNTNMLLMLAAGAGIVFFLVSRGKKGGAKRRK